MKSLCALKAIAAMVVTATLTAGKVSGYVVNIGDLSPNYAGTLMGISNTIANIPGFLAPLVNGVIIGEKVILNSLLGFATCMYAICKRESLHYG